LQLESVLRKDGSWEKKRPRRMFASWPLMRKRAGDVAGVVKRQNMRQEKGGGRNKKGEGVGVSW